MSNDNTARLPSQATLTKAGSPRQWRMRVAQRALVVGALTFGAIGVWALETPAVDATANATPDPDPASAPAPSPSQAVRALDISPAVSTPPSFALATAPADAPPTGPKPDAAAHEADGAPPAPPAHPWQTYTVKSGDTLSGLFSRAGIGAAELQHVLDSGSDAKALAHLRPGDTIRLRLNDDGHIAALRYDMNALDTLAVDRDDGLTARVLHARPRKVTRLATGKVRSTLSGAMNEAGLSPATIARVIGILHWKVNFRRETRPGMRFRILYQTLYRGDKKIGNGPVLAAEIRLRGRTVRAFRFGDGDHANYYDADGHSLRPSLERTPVHYTRVSSPFSKHRFDPVLHVWRAHKGVDLASPRGTPIHAAGDGTITYIGRDGGYGNLIKIHNFGRYSTRYAHMLRFAKGLKRGSHVHQGQVIGYVGATGEATGPHLHFEIRVSGVARNPLKVHLPDAHPVPSSRMSAFKSKVVDPMLAALDHPDSPAAQRVLVADAGQTGRTGSALEEHPGPTNLAQAGTPSVNGD